jgi:glycerol kinase
MTRPKGLLLAIDQGSGSTRALIYDSRGRAVATARRPLSTRTRELGWVEHDPDELLRGVTLAIATAVRSAGKIPCAVGLTTQRSTVVLWNRRNGRPVTAAVSWQDRRAADVCRGLASHGPLIRRLTGLPLSPHYAAPKIRWLLDRIPDGQRRAEQGDLLCGTINTYVLWHLSGGRVFLTDHTQAGRTLLMNLASLRWDPGLCDLFGVPQAMLPEIRPTLADFGEIAVGSHRFPVFASIGDQQAAAIGQGGVRVGDLCLNYGTGAFALLFTGRTLVRCRGLLTNIAWSRDVEQTYVLEGGVNAVGSGIEWLTRMFGLPKDLRALDRIARSGRGSTRMLPALAGLAAPYWNVGAESMISGVSLATERADIVRGFLDGVAFLVAEIVRRAPASVKCRRIVASGGLSVMDLLLELQASYLGHPIRRCRFQETSAWGAAALAGVGAGVWNTVSDAVAVSAMNSVVRPRRIWRDIAARRSGWDTVVRSACSLRSQTGVNQS